MKYSEYIGQNLKKFKERAAHYIQKNIHPSEVHFETQQSTLSLFETDQDDPNQNSQNTESSESSQLSQKSSNNEISDNADAAKNNKTSAPFTVTAAYKDLATLVACVSFDDKWDLLYNLLYRIK